jgi:hypothetical protein
MLLFRERSAHSASPPQPTEYGIDSPPLGMLESALTLLLSVTIHMSRTLLLRILSPHNQIDYQLNLNWSSHIQRAAVTLLGLALLLLSISAVAVGDRRFTVASGIAFILVALLGASFFLLRFATEKAAGGRVTQAARLDMACALAAGLFSIASTAAIFRLLAAPPGDALEAGLTWTRRGVAATFFILLILRGRGTRLATRRHAANRRPGGAGFYRLTCLS